MTILGLTVGSHYPLPVAEGAAAHFFGGPNCVLQIGLPELHKDEIRSYRKDPIRFGFITHGPVILLVIQVGKPGKAAVMECPFDVFKIPADLLSIPDITNDRQRLSVDLHLVELTDSSLKGLRSFTLTPKTTRDFLTAVMNQRAMSYDQNSFSRHYQQLMSYSADQLLRRTKMLPCGR